MRIMFWRWRFDIIGVGYYDNLIHRISCYWASRKKTNVIILDDGVATFDLIKKRNIEKEVGIVQLKNQGSGLTRIIINIWKSRNNIIDELTYFSCLDIKDQVGYDTVVYNDYHFVKSFFTRHFNNKIESNNVYLLGGPYIEDGNINPELYVDVFEQIKNRYSGYYVYYIPHPNETFVYSDKHIAPYILKLNCPFELFALCLKNEDVVIGYFTSVLLNLKSFIPNFKNVYFVDISDKMIASNDYLKTVKEVYEQQRLKLYEITLSL